MPITTQGPLALAKMTFMGMGGGVFHADGVVQKCIPASQREIQVALCEACHVTLVAPCG